jgi:hypothetical protein
MQTDGTVTGRLVRPGKTALHRRWATAWAVQLHRNGGSVRCLAEDVSAYGAKLRVPAGVQAAVDELAVLAVARHTPISVRVAWQRDDWVGVQFATPQPWLVDLVVQATELHDWPSRPVR